MKAIAVVRVPDSLRDAQFRRVHRALFAHLPRVAVLDRGRYACDLRGTQRLLGDPFEVARKVRAALQRADIACAIGIAATPFVARVVAERTPLGQTRESPSDERAFLAPLPLGILPLDPECIEELDLLGLRTVGAFAALPRGAVLDRLGRAAAATHELACGKDLGRVEGQVPPRVIHSRQRWDEPLLSMEQLLFAVRTTVDEVASALATDGLAAVRLAIRLDRDDSEPLCFERSLLPPTADPATLVRSLRWALEERREIGAVVGAAIEVAEVEATRGRQIGLFAPDGARWEEALTVVQHLRAKLGPGAVLQARIAEAGARLREREIEWIEAAS